MKGCFFWSRRFSYIGHAMAMHLKEHYGVLDFCAYVSLRSSFEFLRSQKDICYNKLILDEDIHKEYKDEIVDSKYLQELEQEYGIPNLWPYIEIDRLLRHGQFLRAYPYDTSSYSHEDLLKILQVTAHTLINFLEKEKPDFVLFSAITHIGSFLFYQIAKKKGIKTILIDCARVENLYFLTEQYDRSGYLEEAYLNIKSAIDLEDNIWHKKARSFLTEFQNKPNYYLQTSQAFLEFKKKPIDRCGHFRFLLPKQIGYSFVWVYKSFVYYLKNKYKKDYTVIKPWYEIFDKIQRKFRVLIGFKDIYDKPNPDELYVYFALHTEPEAYPALLAPFYTDQIWLIRQVARSLPIHFKLYVKDHPAMNGFRPLSYYKELRKIPNVKIINPSVSGFDLIQKSKLIITITGTSGWEALLLKKPVIIFGDIYYSHLSAVKKCHAIDTLPYLIKEQLENFIYNEDEIIKFLTAIFQESVPLDLVKIWDIDGGSNMEKNKKEVAAIVDVLAQKLNLKNP